MPTLTKIKPKPKPTEANAGFGARIRDTLFTPNIRHKALFGGRGSGKSWAVATYIVMEAAKVRKRIVCARQFQNSIRDSSKELIERRIRDLGFGNQFTITDRYIFHNKTNTQIMFMGLERNVESIRSLEGADLVWVEEARTISAKSMEILLPTIRAPGSEIIWTWNPEQPEDPVDAYFRKGAPPPRSIVTQVSFNDNPFFELTEMPAELKVLRNGNYQRYLHVWEGQYDTNFESKVFPHTTIGRLEIPPDTPPFYGMDLGFGSDPSVIIKVYYLQQTRQLYIAAEAFGRATHDKLPTLVRSVIYRDDDLIKVDSSRPDVIQFLQARGLNAMPARKGPGSVKTGINFLQGLQITIDPDCVEMQDEARLYSWMTDHLTRKILNAPVDAHNHGWDAVRYACEDAMLEAEADADTDGGVLKLKLW